MTGLLDSTAAPVDRFAPAHYEPEWVPDVVRRFRGRPDTLAVGRPGKVGLLELGFEYRGGRSELARRYQKSPLQIMRPLYIDPRRPDLPVVYVMSTGGGIVQADRLRLDVRCGAHTAVHVTTQAATKVHTMDTDYATQLVTIDAGVDAYVEYLPDPVIPFRRSRLFQRTVVTADPSATVLVGETIYAGRLARDERHRYDVLATDLELHRPGGELVVVDTVRLAPDLCSVTGPAVFAGTTIMSSLFVVTRLRSAPDVADALVEALRATSGWAGVSVLPHECGAWVRMLDDDPDAARAAMRTAWNAARELLIGVPAPALRKC
ncbi:urease accessory protein UreD [Rhodococcus sp. ACT016]|uniref:urease accessory protein UreD n=1 Tax=Rhodococcus sp. ACT016 TaxID=3134808 RepID=UPI003D2C0CE0